MEKLKQTADSQMRQDSIILNMIYRDVDVLESKNVLQVQLDTNLMNVNLNRDIEILRKMHKHLDDFTAKLLEHGLPHHERQAIEAAIIELSGHIVNKTRDVKRRLREKWDY